MGDPCNGASSSFYSAALQWRGHSPRARSSRRCRWWVFIRSTSAATSMPLVAAFRKGLAEAGFVEGKDVAIELRFADDDFGRLPALASDLVRRGVAVIVGNNFAVPAIRAATTTIPVVFVGGDDPVRTGLVTSLNKPGANVTGVTSLELRSNGQAAAIAA